MTILIANICNIAVDEHKSRLLQTDPRDALCNARRVVHKGSEW